MPNAGGPATRAIKPFRRERRDLVQSISRALALLEILSEDDEGYRLIDLSQRAGLSPSTTHRILTTLEQKRFVQLDRESGLWHVGVQCFTIGAVFLRRRNLVNQALPYMRRLRDEVGETINLGVSESGEVVFLAQIESRQMMRAITRPGGRAPMHCSGLGKSILAFMPENIVADVLHVRGMRRLTHASIVRPARLKEVLRLVRKTGYAIDDEEHAIGVRCVAAPIFDEYQSPIAAISLSGPTSRISDKVVGELAKRVHCYACEITGTYGGRVPPAAPDG